jgi:hypothetical protein
LASKDKDLYDIDEVIEYTMQAQKIYNELGYWIMNPTVFRKMASLL